MLTNQRIMDYEPLDTERLIAWLTSEFPGSPPSPNTKALLRAHNKYATPVGMNPRVPAIQFFQETSWPTEKSNGEYVPGNSELFVKWLNPAGMGAPNPGGTAGNPNAAKFIGDPDRAAKAQVSHLLMYALGATHAAAVWKAAGFGDIRDADPRYEAYVDKYGMTSTAPTLADLAGQWAEDEAYAVGMVGWANRSGIEYMVPANGGGIPVPDVAKRPYLLIDAGHRSTDRSGNPAEMAITGFMADAVVTEARKRGYEADWYQRDLDKDSDPDETVGDLNTVALGIGNVIAARTAKGDTVVFISEHYNGANSAIHVIVADNVGLSTAYAGGAPADDNASVNKGDVALASAIAQNYKRDGLGTLLGARRGLPEGIMSERDTGVGLDGYRLAVFAATVRGRANAYRFVVENGGTSDTAARRDDFTTKCATAQLDAIDAFFKVTPSKPAEPVFGKKTALPSVVKLRSVKGRLYGPNAQPRLVLAVPSVPRIGPNQKDAPAAAATPAGKTLTLDYVTAGDGGLVFAAKSGAHYDAEDFKRP